LEKAKMNDKENKEVRKGKIRSSWEIVYRTDSSPEGLKKNEKGYLCRQYHTQ